MQKKDSILGKLSFLQEMKNQPGYNQLVFLFYNSSLQLLSFIPHPMVSISKNLSSFSFAARSSLESAASFSMLQEQLSKVLDGLAERERKVISLRFGLEDGHPHTLEEVGREFGVTRERIRQIESKTLAKLRHPSRSSKLKDYLED